MSLHAVLERGLSHEQARALVGRATHGRTFTWLDPPDDPGAVTVADVHAARDADEHAAAVARWARAVWDAWAAHHAAIRARVDGAFGG